MLNQKKSYVIIYFIYSTEQVRVKSHAQGYLLVLFCFTCNTQVLQLLYKYLIPQTANRQQLLSGYNINVLKNALTWWSLTTSITLLVKSNQTVLKVKSICSCDIYSLVLSNALKNNLIT